MQMRCPRCSTIVNVAAGAMPVCPACGFGAQPGGAAGTAVGASVRAAGATPAARSGLSGGAVAAIALAAVLVLGGAAGALWYFLAGPDEGHTETPAGAGGALTQTEAKQVATAALEDVASAFAGEPASTLRGVSMSMSGDFEGQGQMSGSFDVEWGLGDIMHTSVEMRVPLGGGAAITLNLELFCGDELAIIVYDETAYEARPDSDTCNEVTNEFNADDLTQLGEVEENVVVTPNADGSIDAHFENDTLAFDLEIDPTGHITSMHISSSAEGYDVSMTFLYGARRTLTIPTATDRVPADIYLWPHFGDDQSRIEYAMSMSSPVRRSELELRVLEDAAVIAVFDLAAPTGQTGGIGYQWTGDGDEWAEDNETFRLTSPGSEFYFDYDVVLWDLWADAEVGAETIPGPPFAVLALGLVGAAVAWRRRR